MNYTQADGNLLHVFHKVGGPSIKLPASQPAPVVAPIRSVTPLGPRADARSDDNRSGYDSSDRYATRGRGRRNYDSRDDVVDGSYGFDDHMDTDGRDDKNDRGLYSDNLVSNRGRGRGNSRDRGRGSWL